MKKLAKISLIIAGVFFAAGSIILIICSILADGKMRSELYDTVSPKLHGIADIGFFVPWDFGNNWNGVYLYDFDGANVYTGSHTDGKAASSSNITELYLNLGDGKFTIAPSNDEYFHIRSDGKSQCQYYTEGCAFYVNAFYGKKWSRWLRKNSLTLEIPDKSFDNIDISAGAGSVNISSLKSNKITIDVGAGELVIDDISCNDMVARTGMGSATIKNGSVQDADFEIGMGELAYTGNIAHNLSAVAGMGSMELMLNDSQYDHNYEVDIAMGSITLGNMEYGGFLDYEQRIDNNAGSDYSLECDMGSIEIKFKD